MPNADYIRQVRHKQVKRLLTALYWLEAEAQVLRGRPLDTVRSGNRTAEGQPTEWARKAHRRYLYRVNKIAEEIENRLDPDNQPERPERTRCKGCGRWQDIGWKHCPYCGQQRGTNETSPSPTADDTHPG